jgi:hypothetical protein
MESAASGRRREAGASRLVLPFGLEIGYGQIISHCPQHSTAA